MNNADFEKALGDFLRLLPKLKLSSRKKEAIGSLVSGYLNGEIIPEREFARTRQERDIALEQLCCIGKSIGEQMDDIAVVVRCGWCEYRNKEGNCTFYSGNEKWKDEWEYCSNGKPKK